MLAIIIIVSMSILVAIGFGFFFLLKLIINFKEKELRNKTIAPLVTFIILAIILGGLNTFLIIKFSYDKLKIGLDNQTLPTISENSYRPINEIPNAVIVGSLEINFSIKLSGNREGVIQQINRMAYVELLKVAKEKYGDNIDIVDITWVYVNTDSVIVATKPVEFSAMGKVIKYGTSQ
jgi:hypothetical protein